MKGIKKLTEADMGRFVYYKAFDDIYEMGRIKSFNNDEQFAFVVYNTNDNWDLDHWKDYTAVKTDYKDLYFNK